ncbi:cysteine desulfurase family protein [Rhizorhabdus dicambivorans]|uniref:Cysteine desulfurase n=1 Tax=Rhizorhabdus dicambivorans TaxID=1850238 RepID=A0A2A4G123_9SPHN|nr:aminotransferase class V-fold PLP-dependent enzyme [Rhizorhabdus dicambivorans]ATE64907.1 aminotransferase class V-fold PLP-dependent enzyme [Rhizorhabdus dicambivorans]PCE44181.1 aminotransferase class V-fold PLP-dependent enzyme [Rhizorhabdus dicambivorans]
MAIPRLYLDHAATTPLLPAARAAMAEGLERWANPSSPHAEGRAARAALEDARARIARALGATGTILFTSGATEALEIALRRGRGERSLVSAVEHDAVRRAAPAAGRLPVSADGIVQPGPLKAGTLVAIQAVNNETGVIQPLGELGVVVREAGGLLLADCAQSAGKMPLPDADFIGISAHKLGGPPGIGALIVRDLTTLEPSGGQEQGYRGGTENLPAVLGFAVAAEADAAWLDRARILRARLDAAIRENGGAIVADGAERLPTIASYRMPGVAATGQLIRFDLAGIAVSAGSACSSGSLKPSHVLAAMGWSEGDAREVIRVSFGRDTNEADIDRFISEWRAIAESARARAA